jgi:hypothetical protein
MATMKRYTPWHQAPPLPTSCHKCGSADISGPHNTQKRAESQTGRCPALVTRAWFCRECWQVGEAVFELGFGQPMPASGPARAHSLDAGRKL